MRWRHIPKVAGLMRHRHSQSPDDTLLLHPFQWKSQILDRFESSMK